jgi:hypothetical protein
MRDLEVIDCELRLFLAIRKMAREADGRTPNTARIDALLDERSATMVLNTTVAPAYANRLSEAAAVRSEVADKLRAHFENTGDHQG